jgi:hypothetical protein
MIRPSIAVVQNVELVNCFLSVLCNCRCSLIGTYPRSGGSWRHGLMLMNLDRAAGLAGV